MENWKFALSSIMQHKMRSFLTMLGIIIGVGAVIVIMSLGTGLKQNIAETLSKDKDNVQLIFMGDDQNTKDFFNSGIPEQPSVQATWLDKLTTVQGVDMAYGTNSASGMMEYNKKKVNNVSITGIDNNYFKVKKIKIIKGRGYTESDFSHFARIMIVDKTLAKNLFSNEDEALNKIVTINDHAYRVIGVYEEDSNMSYGNLDGSALMTNTQVAAEFNTTEINNIYVHVDDVGHANEIGKLAAKKLTSVAGLKEGKYDILDLSVIEDEFNSQLSVVTTVVGAIASISLLVGGIGVMNIMLVSVTERTREIGLRKALGATRAKIMTQFLIEAVVLTIIGGIIGILLAFGISSIIGVAFSEFIKPVISIPVMIGSIVFSALIGIIFGILPASKASKLNPIEALRYE